MADQSGPNSECNKSLYILVTYSLVTRNITEMVVFLKNYSMRFLNNLSKLFLRDMYGENSLVIYSQATQW